MLQSMGLQRVGLNKLASTPRLSDLLACCVASRVSLDSVMFWGVFLISQRRDPSLWILWRRRLTCPFLSFWIIYDNLL